MIFYLFFSTVLSADPKPAINKDLIHGYIPPGTQNIPECEEGFIFDTFTFACTANGSLTTQFDPKLTYIINGTTVQQYNDTTATIPQGFIKVENFLIEQDTYTNSANTLCSSILDPYKARCIDLASLYYASAAASVTIPVAVQFIVNLYVLNDYNQQGSPLLTDFITVQYIMNYNYWPSNLPFFTYPTQRQITLANILDEQYITSHFRFSQVTQFYLARYSWDGIFIGFSPLTLQLNKCGEKNDIEQMWRRFGTNYQSQCFYDLIRSIDQQSNELYELFIEDGTDDVGDIIIRPIPVVFQDINCRRFYIFNNITSSGGADVTKIIDSTRIQFNILESDPTMIQTPYFVFSVRSIPSADLNDPPTGVRFTTNTNQHPLFSFNVTYSMNLTNFQQLFMILAIVTGVLALLVVVARLFFVSLTDGKYGMNGTNIVKAISVVFDTVGLYFFIITFAFAAFILIFFKWQKAIFWCLPPESFYQFRLMRRFLYVSLAFEIVAVLLNVFVNQLSNIFIILDWESPEEKDESVSAWRRINVSNELNRITNIRSYSIPFTVIVSAFILTGFDVELLSTPIPSTRLITTGFSHWVLRFAVSSCLWLILMAGQYIFFHFIYWRFYGNPFFNFLDLCTTSNLSVFIATSMSHGYYLHGKSVHGYADVEMKKLAECLVDEEEGQASLRGLLPNTKEQVFEIFFTLQFYNILSQMQQSLQSQQHLLHFTVSAKEIPQHALQSYDEMNELLKSFFSGSNSNKYNVQPPELLQIIFGAPPQINDVSIMNKIKDNLYKRSLLGGVEWGLMVMYMLIFCTIDMSTKSPCISCFVVYAIDFLITWIYQRIFRSKLARTSLLDSRFLLS
ncbi:hypothetical protein TRFO_02347 [Tritrichomonas foetus]|uniref:Meckelin n=1 Tax=Tritrichomonas foetus TaxID=1144522 RepID=A0A1J4J824_9EUKA|nr:hypothetical protein TRFO_02347 [Tritrichomonas foetus]|eukprot:OHS93827.1 hypothetical protein TRFO_02347 [Tritrichomonas foetus]